MSNSPLSNFNEKISSLVEEAKEEYATYRQAEEIIRRHDIESTKLAILTGFLGAKEGWSSNEVLKLMVAELTRRDIPLPNDLSEIRRQIKSGFDLFEINPELTSQQVYCISLDWLEN